jgi:hypothetical protein
MSYFEKVKNLLLELNYPIVNEVIEEEILVITDEQKAIFNMVLDCEDGLLVIEQAIAKFEGDNPELFKQLLQINRSITHGAFVLDEHGHTLIYRDTLQLENLDANELEASINALTLALIENMDFFLSTSKEKTDAVGV